MLRCLRPLLTALAGVLGVPLLLALALAPTARVAAQPSGWLTTEPDFVHCPDGTTQLATIAGMVRRDKPPHQQQISVALADPGTLTVVGYVKEGHPESCPGGADCGQGQMHEEIKVLVDDQLIGEHFDQGADVEAWIPAGPWTSDTLAAGEQTVTVAHRMQGTTAESVGFKLTVCSQPAVVTPPVTPPCVVDLQLDGGAAQTSGISVGIRVGVTADGPAEVRFAEYVYSDGWAPTAASLSAPWLPYDPLTTYRWDLSSDPGVHYIQAWARDAAGNVSSPACARQAAINRVVCARLPVGSIHRSRIFRYVLPQNTSVQVRVTSTVGDADLYVYPPDYTSGRPAWYSTLASPAVDQVDFVTPIAGMYQVEVFRQSSAASYCIDVAIAGDPPTPGPAPARAPALGAARVAPVGPSVPLDLTPVLVWPLPAAMAVPAPLQQIYLPRLTR